MLRRQKRKDSWLVFMLAAVITAALTGGSLKAAMKLLRRNEAK
jgi:hypothetical protein